MEDPQEGTNFIFYDIFVGTMEAEYGYALANEMVGIEVVASRYGL